MKKRRGDADERMVEVIALLQRRGFKVEAPPSLATPPSIEVSFMEYKNAVYLDIRTYSQFDGQDQKQPTKRGITLKPNQIHELREALEKAEAAAPA